MILDDRKGELWIRTRKPACKVQFIHLEKITDANVYTGHLTESNPADKLTIEMPDG